ncbi:NfeD family protein [Sulfidibacter corallicola]|uniref:NfeD family protein n=1 Tax=Sulfidibacter corallicola TaxID=2818388 RepID=A0A8A4TSR9_SULCO|nr:NfeD family protein [Sulfidibacter corallicola]QTD52204.1 NfeD family protein [Sulfidibacter corallicola]
MWILLLSLIGLCLILVDVLAIPGSVFALIGTGFIGYSIYLNYLEYGFVSAALHFVVCAAVIPALVLFVLKRWTLKGEMAAEDGYVGIEKRAGFIGCEGIAFSDLRPSGTVAIDRDGEELHLDCITDGRFIEKGSRVKIVEERGPSLVVRAAD